MGSGLSKKSSKLPSISEEQKKVMADIHEQRFKNSDKYNLEQKYLDQKYRKQKTVQRNTQTDKKWDQIADDWMH